MAMAADGQVSLSWTPNTEDDFQHYHVYSDTSPSPTVKIHQTAAGNAADTSHTVTGLMNGQTYHFRVTAVDQAGNESPHSIEVSATPTRSTGVEDQALPTAYALDPNYPNPFNPSTVIAYAVVQANPVRLVVYDVLGREVRTLVNAVQPAGFYRVRFEASQLASGIYFYRLEVGNAYQRIRQMLLVR